SKILVFQTKASANNGLTIINNPVKDKLTFSFQSTGTEKTQINVYDLTGRKQLSQQVNSYQGNNIVSLPMASTFKNGVYIIEVVDDQLRSAAKFIKQ
ncbi:MAG: T9SS type A sorting domain-containing protein, partial [Bacteroidota bacterium]|nr:T9SS type A sorting domain-containing protein [Bacteroidota bacterium]